MKLEIKQHYFKIIKNDIISFRGGRFYFTAGKSHRTGFEIGANIQLKHGISLNTAFTYSSNNSFDKKYAGSAFINPDTVDSKPVYLEPGMPRNVTASIVMSIE